eukprot:55234-Chlamydomonas_euryale.AAC.1
MRVFEQQGAVAVRMASVNQAQMVLRGVHGRCAPPTHKPRPPSGSHPRPCTRRSWCCAECTAGRCS